VDGRPLENELLRRLAADVSDDRVPKRDTSRLGRPDHAGLVHDDALPQPEPGVGQSHSLDGLLAEAGVRW